MESGEAAGRRARVSPTPARANYLRIRPAAGGERICAECCGSGGAVARAAREGQLDRTESRARNRLSDSSRGECGSVSESSDEGWDSRFCAKAPGTRHLRSLRAAQANGCDCVNCDAGDTLVSDARSEAAGNSRRTTIPPSSLGSQRMRPWCSFTIPMHALKPRESLSTAVRDAAGGESSET